MLELNGVDFIWAKTDGEQFRCWVGLRNTIPILSIKVDILNNFCRLPFLNEKKVDECFAEDLMEIKPCVMTKKLTELQIIFKII